MDKQIRKELNEIWKLNFNLRALIVDMQQQNLKHKIVLQDLFNRFKE